MPEEGSEARKLGDKLTPYDHFISAATEEMASVLWSVRVRMLREIQLSVCSTFEHASNLGRDEGCSVEFLMLPEDPERVVTTEERTSHV